MPYVGATVAGVASTAAPASPAGRGACPSVHAPFLELDGALLRIRLPGGVLRAPAARALATLAHELGAGPVELTNRANLQLRGVPPGATSTARDALVATGLALPDPDADERRNVLASPTAGIDQDEVLDTRSLVAAIAARLASPAAVGLSPKFGVLVDGGGAVHVRGRVHDIALGAARAADGSVWYEIRLASGLPVPFRAGEPVLHVDAPHALEAIDALIEMCAPFGRAADAVAQLGRARAGRELEQRSGGAIVASDRAELSGPGAESMSPVGAHPQRDGGRVFVGGVPVLGRLDPLVLGRLATLAEQHGSGEVRVTPWRGLVVPHVSATEVEAVLASCDDLGLVCDPAHPANVVVACAGECGCAAGLADTQADARVVIQHLATVAPAERPRSLHVSGCDKGCARPRPADVSLVAGPTRGRYELYTGAPGSTDTRFGDRVASGLGLRDALQRIGAKGTPT